MQKNKCRHGDHDDHPKEIRDAEKVPARKTRKGGIGDRNSSTVGDKQAHAAQRGQRRQGHNKGRQSQLSNAKGVKNPDGKAEGKRDQDRRPDRKALR